MDKKIYLRVRGGLGNQMFQFAFAYMLRKKYDFETIVLDIREYDRYRWPFDLDKFCLSKETELSKSKQKYDFWIKIYHFYSGIFRKIKRKSPTSLSKFYLKKGCLFCGQRCDSIPFINKNNLYLYGYFQNYCLFDLIRGDLIHLFSLKNKNNSVNQYSNKIKKNSVSVSVRFPEKSEIDDNIKYSYAEKDYYEKIVEKIETIRGSGLQIVVSSNNIGRIKQEKWFAKKNVLFIEGCSAPEQIEILKKCNDFVMSNSTFSWWVAYLGSYKKKSIIISPRKWFNDQDVNTTKLMFNGVQVFDDFIV